MIKSFILRGLFALLLAALFPACGEGISGGGGTGGGEEKVVVFSLEKDSDFEFSLTVNGANWVDVYKDKLTKDGDAVITGIIMLLAVDSVLDVKGISFRQDVYYLNEFECELSDDYKTIKTALKESVREEQIKNGGTGTLSGTLKFNTVIQGEWTDGGSIAPWGNTIYEGVPVEGITFP